MLKDNQELNLFFFIPPSLLTWPHVSEADKVSNVR